MRTMLSPTASNIRDVSTLPLPVDVSPRAPPSSSRASNRGVNPTTTPTRPKHTLSRSISDFSPPMHKHHALHRHHHGHRDRGLTPLDTRSAVVSPAGSRRPSLSDDRNGVSNPSASLPGVPREWERRLVTADELGKQRGRSVQQVMELKKELVDMNELSNSTTRRLDSTYYMVLEKLSSLHSTMSSLKELAVMSRALKGEFERESRSVVGELETQLDGFDGFAPQEEKIRGLETRITTGRDRVKKLGKRVKVVSEKIEVWETLEGQWQQKMRSSKKIMWMVTAFVSTLVLGLVLSQYTPGKTQGLGVFKGLNLSNLSMEFPDLPKSTELLINETLHMKRTASDVLEVLRKPPERTEDNPVLRAFDEL